VKSFQKPLSVSHSGVFFALKKVVSGMKDQLQRNIWVLYVFSFFWLSMVIIPIIVPLFESRGLNLAQVLYLQAIFAGFVVLFEVPSGYIADAFGRKNTLVAGSIFHGIGFSWLYFAEGFFELVVFEMIVGLGMSLLSGADLSLLYDSQVALKHSPAQKTRGIANLRFVKSMAEGVSALLGGFLIIYSFEATVLANAIFAWGPLVMSFYLVEAPFSKMEMGQPIVNLKRVVAHLFFEDKLLRLICLNITFFSLSTFYVVWLLQPYWRDLGVPLTLFGVLWAAQSFLFAFVSKICLPLENRFGARPILIVMAALPIAGYFGMASTGGIVGILFSFTFFVSRGLNQVILTDALNSRVPSEFRATANSMTSFVFRGIYIVTGPIIGLVIDWQDMYFALNILGVVCIFLFLIILLPLLREIERHRQDEESTEQFQETCEVEA
jgi:MFS family permease